MTIKDDFWELIKSGNKTIELRKVKNITHLFLNNGRDKFYLEDENNNDLGTITINGYSIISKKNLLCIKI